MAFNIASSQGAGRASAQFQNNVQGALGKLSKNPLIDGIVLTSVALALGDNNVPHKLGRTLVGWQMIRQRAPATVYDKQDANPTPTDTLALTASAACVVDLYVF